MEVEGTQPKLASPTDAGGFSFCLGAASGAAGSSVSGVPGVPGVLGVLGVSGDSGVCGPYAGVAGGGLMPVDSEPGCSFGGVVGFDVQVQEGTLGTLSSGMTWRGRRRSTCRSIQKHAF